MVELSKNKQDTPVSSRTQPRQLKFNKDGWGGGGQFQARHKGQVWRNETRNKCWCQKVSKQAIKYI